MHGVLQNMTLPEKQSPCIVPSHSYGVQMEAHLGYFLLLTIAYQHHSHKSEFNCKLANKLCVNTPWVAQYIPLPNYSTIHKELMAASLCFYT